MNDSRQETDWWAHVPDTIRKVEETCEYLEAKGFRIVEGGLYDDDDRWEVTDWRTGASLARGRGGIEAMYQACPAIEDPTGEDWIHLEHVVRDVLEHES